MFFVSRKRIEKVCIHALTYWKHEVEPYATNFLKEVGFKELNYVIQHENIEY